MSTYAKPVKIQIISRYIPIENTAGHFTYLLDFMRYLRHAGGVLELVVLDPWLDKTVIPSTVQDIANVYIRKLPQSEYEGVGYEAPSVKLKDFFQPFYRCLPPRLLHPIRKMAYRVRGETLPETRPWNALITRDEMRFARSRIEKFRPDIVIANYAFLSDVFDMVSESERALKVIVTYDVRHQRVESYKKAGLHSDDSGWNWSNESEQLRKADVLLAIQHDDAKMLKQMAPQSEVFCAPMSATYCSHDPASQIPGRCLFIASNIDHNVYGLRWFLKKVWPIILRAIPHCSLNVCGSVCHEIRKSFPNVQFLGRIHDLRSEYAAAEVCLIPLIVGGGLKIKLIEALSHGRACVATSVGVQGVQEIANKAALVADSPEDFAMAVVAVLSNSEERRAMEEYARDYVKERLAPEKIYQPFIDRIYQHVYSIQS